MVGRDPPYLLNDPIFVRGLVRWTGEMLMDVANVFIDVVNSMTPDLGSLYEDAKNSSLDDWTFLQKSLVTASGAAAVAIPGLHLVGAAADIAFLVNRMGVSSYGVGAIKLSDSDMGNLLEPEDFGAVLSYWSGDDDLRQLIKGKAAADLSSKAGIKLVTKSGGKIAVKGLTKALLASGGYMIGAKLGGKAMAKPAAKFASKAGGKFLGGFVPFLGPVIGGGINLWLISSIISASEEFYSDKMQLINRST